MSRTALPRTDAGGDALEQRCIAYRKLLRQAPSITDITWIGPEGREPQRVSRLTMDAVGAGADLSREPKSARSVPAAPTTARCTSARAPGPI